MRHLLCMFIVIVIVFIACDQDREMMTPVIQDVVTDDVLVVPIEEDTTVYSQYDINQDGKVDNTDLALVSAAIGEKQPTNPRLDVDGSGIVDATDIRLVSENFDELVFGTETEKPTEAETVVKLPVDFAGVDDPAEEPTIPEGLDVLESDSVRHYTAERFEDWEPFIYDSLNAAAESKFLKGFFDGVKDWGQDECLNPGTWRHPPAFAYIGFTTRVLRDEFKDLFPGGWTNDPENEPDKRWIIEDKIVIIVDGTDTYYIIDLIEPTGNPCFFR